MAETDSKSTTIKAAKPAPEAPPEAGSAAHVKYAIEELYYSIAKNKQRGFLHVVGSALSTVDRLAAAAGVNIEDIL
jgi:hypothetical protein